MTHSDSRPLAILSIGWFAAFLYYGFAIAVIFGARKVHDWSSFKSEWELSLFIAALSHVLVNITETRFVLTKTEFLVKKPFFPFLFDRRYPLDSLRTVECHYKTGKTLQPRIVLYFKDDKRNRWFTTASEKSVKNFLAAVEQAGLSTNFTYGKFFLQ